MLSADKHRMATVPNFDLAFHVKKHSKRQSQTLNIKAKLRYN
ncbi:MAG: hypothetical protein H6Q14_1273 [Bacteroidetes bacterium]|nr:hypothetical protein [Bacteroidota bacterium]